MGCEYRPFGLHRHIGTVRMPSHVALEDLDDVIGIVVSAKRSVGPYIAERSQFELELAESLCEHDLFLVGEMLIRKDEQCVFEPSGVHFRKAGVVDR